MVVGIGVATDTVDVAVDEGPTGRGGVVDQTEGRHDSRRATAKK